MFVLAFIAQRVIHVPSNRKVVGARNAFKMRAVGMAHVVLGKTVRIARRIVRALVVTNCAPWVNRAAIVLAIAVRVAAMVNATMEKRVRAATRIAARVRSAKMAYAKRAKTPAIARMTVLPIAAMARAG